MTQQDSDIPLSATGFEPTGAAPGSNSDAPLSASAFQPLDPNRQGPRKPWALWLGAAAVASLILALLTFLLTARSFEVVVAAVGDADIRIDGLAVPLGQRYLIRPGVYPVQVRVDGYLPWNGEVEVSDADSQRLEVSPAILPGRVSITSEPEGASLFLDGEPLGEAPLTRLELDAGDHQLEARAPRYQPFSQTLEITGRGVEQVIAINLQPDWANVAISTEPVPADIWRDGQRIGQTNRSLELLSGNQAVVLRAPGYEDFPLSLSIEAGVGQELGPFQLTPADGVLALTSSPTGANVTVDGRFVGRTPLSVSLTPEREHLIQLSRAGYNRSSVRLALERGASAERDVVLTPQLGDIAFNLEPADAELIIDGKSVGRGSRTVALPSVEHRVEVRLEGYASERTRVTPRPGLEQVLDITLLTESEARRAALTAEITTALGQTLLLIDPVAEVMNEFRMGASRREPGRRANEVEHSVRLERAFYIATTETTNAQFRQFLASHDSGQIEGNSLNREHQPAVRVSWQQAARFCNWLSNKEGLAPFYRENQGIIVGYNPSSTGYRLPSEAEWSFTARIEGERYRRFDWGDDFPPSQAVINVADNTSALVTGRILNGYADGHIVAAPVASFPANHRGLYDMGGNVAEWVHDVYSIPSANAEVSVNPLGSQQGDNYTVRGASWALSRLSELRLTYRDYGAAGRDDVGFRIARYAE